MTSLNLVRPDLKDNIAYAPSDETLTYRLNTNELPWSPLPSEQAALNRYPSIEQERLLQSKLADLYQVSDDELLITRGSDEGIECLMRLFLNPGQDGIIQCPPTFSMYGFFARLYQGFVIDCPLNEEDGFQVPIEQLDRNWNPGCKLIMLCRPNNPTGNSIDLSVVTALCERFQNRSIIVVDEAYIEFSGEISATSLIRRFDNIIVLRTLSKAYGLAGLRLGAVIAQPCLLEILRNTLPPFRLASTVMNTARLTVADTAWFTQKIAQIQASRQTLSETLQTLPWIERVYPSAANFLLIKTRDAFRLFQWLSQNDIAVRQFSDHPPLQYFLRITIGNRMENTLLLDAFRAFQGEDIR
ncbi:MAG: histidinol-phosphate transaminase [Gammaproteobacteria bacterium]|nr:histidinol-phosphate transaminase [Gammaproteobacteria bacterium]